METFRQLLEAKAITVSNGVDYEIIGKNAKKVQKEFNQLLQVTTDDAEDNGEEDDWSDSEIQDEIQDVMDDHIDDLSKKYKVEFKEI